MRLHLLTSLTLPFLAALSKLVPETLSRLSRPTCKQGCLCVSQTQREEIMGRSSPFSVSNFPLPTPHRGLMPGPYFPGAIAAAPSTLLPSPVLRKHLHLRAAPSTLLPSPVLRKHLHLRDAEGGGIRNSPGAEHQNISSECHALLSNGVLGGCSKIVQVVTALDPSSNRFHSSLLGSTE